MLLTPQSTFAPEPPAAMVARLQQIHPALGLRFVPQGGDLEGYWGFIWNWPDNDPRRRRILTGEFDPAMAFDLLSMLPLNCSVDEAYAYAVNTFQRSSDAGIKSLLDRISEYNKEATNLIWSGATDEANNMIEVMGHKLFAAEGRHVPKSYGGLSASQQTKR